MRLFSRRNRTAEALLERMDRAMERFERERAARKKVEPLVRQIREAYYRFPGGSPTRLHVSEAIYKSLWDSLCESGDIVSGIRFFQCPVIEFPDLAGFRWVRGRSNCWECGPVIVPWDVS